MIRVAAKLVPRRVFILTSVIILKHCIVFNVLAAESNKATVTTQAAISSIFYQYCDYAKTLRNSYTSENPVC